MSYWDYFFLICMGIWIVIIWMIYVHASIQNYLIWRKEVRE